mmetsp:Transcript_93532/g.301029  ORF Transcript_93532/g.301029 Transcript_93532/m.301029 type:complete len:106 (-) Transcript_93532:15-332(-)
MAALKVTVTFSRMSLSFSGMPLMAEGYYSRSRVLALCEVAHLDEGSMYRKIVINRVPSPVHFHGDVGEISSCHHQHVKGLLPLILMPVSCFAVLHGRASSAGPSS